VQIERTAGSSNLIDVLDRVLDKGIVIDAWVRVALVGIELVTVEARVVIASIATYLGYADTLADVHRPATSAPAARATDRPSRAAIARNGHPGA
jgi:gas vesicle structural protein